MNRAILAGSVIVGIAVVLSISMMPAFAGAPSPAAFVIEGGFCALFNGNGQIVVVNDPDNISVGTSSGHSTGICHASGVAPAPGPGPFKASGFGCNIILQDGSSTLTFNTRALVTPDGESLLVCRLP